MQTVRDLAKLGMDSLDDEYLRWYVSGRARKVTDVTEIARANWVKDVLAEMRGDQFWTLRTFLIPKRPEVLALSDLTAAAFACDEAIDAYARLTDNDRPPSGDGEKFLKWADDGANGRLYFAWITDLDARYSAGRASAEEGRALHQIQEAGRKRLSSMIDDFNRAKAAVQQQRDWEAREATREAARRARHAERVALAARGATTSPKPKRRSHGELPPEPEVTTRPRRP